MLKPVLPIVEYVVNNSYIVAQLCEDRFEEENTCQGTCHLNKQIAAAENQQQHPQTPMQIELKDYPIEIVTQQQSEQPLILASIPLNRHTTVPNSQYHAAIWLPPS